VSKRTRASFTKKVKCRAKNTLELVHAGVVGPVEKSLSGANYATVLTEDAARWKVVYPTKSKAEALPTLKRYTEDVKVLTKGHRLKALWLLSEEWQWGRVRWR